MVNAVNHRVTHVEVAGSQIDFGPESHLAVLKLAGAHPGEEIQALLNGPVPIGAGGRGGEVAAVFSHLVRGQLTHIGQTLFDEAHRQFVHFFKVIGGIIETVLPVVTQPVDVLFNGVHILGVLFGGVGIVHTQIADAAEALCRAEINVNGLGVPDMQVAVGLGREPGVNLHSLTAAALG